MILFLIQDIDVIKVCQIELLFYLPRKSRSKAALLIRIQTYWLASLCSR